MKLYNNIEIPSLGFGTWKLENGDIAYNAVRTAIDVGYRHIDTAYTYGNEESVGKAIADSGVERDKIFLTSKVKNSFRGYDTTLECFDLTLKGLKVDYVDLYLIHWPANSVKYDNPRRVTRDTWKAIEKIYKDGRARAIGVSNFKVHHLNQIMDMEIQPMVDQIEFHPGQTQDDTRTFCTENNILVEAWSPLGSGRMLSNEDLIRIAGKYGKSVAQLCIRFCLENNVLPLVRSTNRERMLSNLDVLDFTISDEDMEYLLKMPYFGGSGHDPDKVTF